MSQVLWAAEIRAAAVVDTGIRAVTEVILSGVETWAAEVAEAAVEEDTRMYVCQALS